MFKKIMLCALGLIALNTHAQVVPNIDWVQNYSDRPFLDNVPSTLDANNNVYVTGYTSAFSKDLIVLKYDSLGTLLWSYSYDNGGDDIGRAIKVSSTGDVYVTGVSYGTSDDDYITLKLSPTGALLWMNRYDNGYNEDAVDIKIEETNSYIYITGTSYNGTNNDIITIRYKDPSGSLDWINSFNGTGSDEDLAVGLAVTDPASSNIVVCGNSKNGSGNMDIVAFQLDAAGNPGWSYTLDGTANTDDRAESIILAGGNFAICGMVSNTSTNDDYTTLLINSSSGSLVWKMDYDVSNGYEAATSLVRDSIGNIAVTGYVNNSSIYEYHTLLYDSTGTQLWTNIENTGIAGLYIEPRIATDTIAHHFYVAGAKANISNDVSVYQISPTGNTKWKRIFDGPANGHDAGTGLAVNGVGVCYVSALCTNTASGFDITTIKISQTPIYYPIDPNNVNDSCSKAHYFYPNVGEVLDLTNSPVADVVFSTKNTYPQQYVLSNNNMAFLISHLDTAKNTNTFVDSLFRVDMEFVKGNRLTNAFATEYKNDNVINYLLQYVDSLPITDVKGSSRIMIPNIYPSIDLHYYSNSSGLKMYFVVKPGGIPGDIEMNFNGASTTTINGSNELVVGTTLGQFKFNQPLVYNVTSTSLTTANATGTIGWVSMGGNNYKINTGSYLTALPLIIQVNQGPAVSVTSATDNLTYSSYFGGTGNEVIKSSATNNSGFIYYCGTSTSPNLPPATGFQAPLQPNSIYGNRDGFVAGTQNAGLYYRTYIGGDRVDQILDVEVDHPNNDDIYLVGTTTSSVFPIQAKSGAYNKSTFVGPLSISLGDKDDGFIMQLNSQLGTNKWCTYYGGGHFDYISDCKLDANGNLFVLGSTASTNIAVFASGSQYNQSYNTLQLSQSSYVYDGLIMKFAAGTSSLSWGTYFGSASNASTTTIADDFLYDLDFDASGNVYVGGRVGGIDLPGKINNRYNSSSPDGFIAKFTNNGQLLSSKHTQGNTDNYSVKVKNSKVYMCGQNDVNITTVNSGNYYYNGTNNNGGSPGMYEGNFIVYDLSFNAIHATYIGGNGNDKATDLQFDNHGLIYVCGGSESTNFPIVGPANTYTSANSGGYDYFVLAMQEGNPNLLWSTQIGTNKIESDYGNAASMSIDQFTGLYISGVTTSTVGYPIWNASGSYFQNQSGGGTQDGTITRFWLDAVQLVGVSENIKDAHVVSIYPNPTIDYLHFDNSKLDNKEVIYNVYNMMGQNVQTGKLDPNGNKTIDVNNLPFGTYVITFNTENSNFYSKFVKIK